jgi:hypothetical protein
MLAIKTIYNVGGIIINGILLFIGTILNIVINQLLLIKTGLVQVLKFYLN